MGDDVLYYTNVATTDINEKYSENHENFVLWRHLKLQICWLQSSRWVTSNTLDLIETEEYQDILFIVFVILTSIDLFNLSNALTIININILRTAELVEAKKTVSILKGYDKMFVILRLSLAKIFPRTYSNCSNAVLCEPKQSLMMKSWFQSILKWRMRTVLRLSQLK